MEENKVEEKHEHYRFDIDPGQSLTRIDKFLTDKISGISRNRLQTAAKNGDILVNGKAVKSNYKIRPNDVVQVMQNYEPEDYEVIPQDIPINIVYEDDTLMVVNKNPGMVVHPGHGNKDGTLVNAIAWHLKHLPLFNTGDMRPGLVHRLDKDTSGILVIAKTEEAMTHLAKQFFNRTTGRRYYALVWGEPKEEEGTIIGKIGRHPKNRKQRFVFDDDSEEGKHAVTHYKILERFGYVTLLECRLETGRTHQIRVHMQTKGHHLFNDSTYGGDRILKGTTFTKYKQFVQNCFKLMPRQSLHAKSLSFDHPVTGERMEFESELPEDFTSVLAKWRGYVAGRQKL